MQERKLIIPSNDWAWMLGLLSGGGGISEQGQISLVSSNDHLINVYKSRGERLFHLNARAIPYEFGSVNYYYRFQNKSLAVEIGDLRRNIWSETIKNKHNWILDNSNYSWRFFEGYFETRGSINTKAHTRRINLHTKYIGTANFLTEFLARLGINSPTISHDKEAREGVSGVTIYRIDDLQRVANNIHSIIPNKEEKLRLLRQIEISNLRSANPQPSYQELIREWIYLYKLIGHFPSEGEVERLLKEGETRFHSDVYIYRFGRFEGKRNYTKARERLKEIFYNLIDEVLIRTFPQPKDQKTTTKITTSEELGKEINSCLKDYEKSTGIQIKFTPKSHRIYDRESRTRLDQILSKFRSYKKALRV